MAKAARDQRARARGLIARIDRQVAAYDAQRPERIARNERIKTARRDVRRATRARASAERARRAAEVRAGAAVRRLLDEGLSVSDATPLLGLSRGAAKRLLRIAAEATDLAGPTFSTDSTDDRAADGVGAHGEDSGPAISGPTNEGNL